MATRQPAEPMTSGAGDGAMKSHPCRIRRVIKETHDTFSCELDPPKGPHPWSFAPGQFNMLYVYGVGEVPISISGNPGRPGVLVHTTREVGEVTSAMRRLKAGQALGVRGPYGRPWPVDEANGRDLLMITGGIGLAPLRPVLYHALAHRDRYGKVVLLYGARTPEDILYWRELEKWRSRFDLEIHLTVDRATGAWRGNVGVVTQLIPRSPFDPLNCLAMICGPEIMLRFTALELEKRGVNGSDVYVSMERNMKCGIGLCGHCQLGGSFVCKDGPVFRYDQIGPLLMQHEV